MEVKTNEKNNLADLSVKKDSIRALGQAYEIKSNRLSALMDLPAGGSAEGLIADDELKAVLKTLLYPGNLSVITVMLRDLGLKHLTVCMGTSGGVSVGVDQENILLKPTDLDDYTDYLTGLFDNGTLLESLGTALSLSRDGLYTLLSAVDLFTFNRMMAILEKKTAIDPLTLTGIKGQAVLAIEEPDPRLLTTAVLSTDRLRDLFNVDRGIEELDSLGILEKIETEKLKLTAEGQQLLEGLAEPEILTGIRSYYYEEGTLTEMGFVLVRTRKYLWGVELGDEPMLVSLNFERLYVYLYSLLGRGDYSDGLYDESAEIEEDGLEENIELFEEDVIQASPEDTVAAPKICPNCKKELKGAEKFCTVCGADLRQVIDMQDTVSKKTDQHAAFICQKCGKSLESGAKFCKYCGTPTQTQAVKKICSGCGAEVLPGAKFCKKCGQKQ